MSDSRSDESDFSDDGFEDDMDAGRKSSGGRRDDSDDDFEFGGESYAESDSSPARGGARSKGGSAEGKRSSGGGRGGGSQQSTKLQNLPFDEAVELASDSDSLGTSVDTIDAPSPKLGDSRGDSPPRSRDTSDKAEYGGSDEPKVS